MPITPETGSLFHADLHVSFAITRQRFPLRYLDLRSHLASTKGRTVQCSPGRTTRSRCGSRAVLSALAPGGGYQSSWGTLLLVFRGMNRDAVPGMSINGRQTSV